ncbi:MAG: T9SS type A sorting domain-containing protein, partial [Bacteroidota bacterium]
QNKDDNNYLLSAEDNFANITMQSATKAVLTITNPQDDEYTTGVTLKSLQLTTSPGVSVQTLKPSSSAWSNGVMGTNGFVSEGVLNPGESINFNIDYNNADSFKSWLNTLKFTFMVKDIPDTLNGDVKIMVRTPGAVGGDVLVDVNNGTKLGTARTYALSFRNANMTRDSISEVILKLDKGSILAVGPNESSQEVSLKGFRTSKGNLTLLNSSPDESVAVMSNLPADIVVNPIYLTVMSDEPGSSVLEYITLTSAGDTITVGSLELTNPVLGVSGREPNLNLTSIWLYEAQPNPSNDETLIRFELQKAESNVRLAVYDALGKSIAILVGGKPMSEGVHEVVFNRGNLSNGVYYYTISTGNETQTRKLIFIR